MFSHVELLHIMEKAFTPTLCNCTISAQGMMTLELLDPHSHAPQLTVTDIPIASLTGGRAMAALVRDIKEQVARQQAGEPAPVKRQG